LGLKIQHNLPSKIRICEPNILIVFSPDQRACKDFLIQNTIHHPGAFSPAGMIANDTKKNVGWGSGFNQNLYYRIFFTIS